MNRPGKEDFWLNSRYSRSVHITSLPLDPRRTERSENLVLPGLSNEGPQIPLLLTNLRNPSRDRYVPFRPGPPRTRTYRIPYGTEDPTYPLPNGVPPDPPTLTVLLNISHDDWDLFTIRNNRKDRDIDPFFPPNGTDLFRKVYYKVSPIWGKMEAHDGYTPGPDTIYRNWLREPGGPYLTDPMGTLKITENVKRDFWHQGPTYLEGDIRVPYPSKTVIQFLFTFT